MEEPGADRVIERAQAAVGVLCRHADQAGCPLRRGETGSWLRRRRDIGVLLRTPARSCDPARLAGSVWPQPCRSTRRGGCARYRPPAAPARPPPWTDARPKEDRQRRELGQIAHERARGLDARSGRASRFSGSPTTKPPISCSAASFSRLCGVCGKPAAAQCHESGGDIARHIRKCEAQGLAADVDADQARAMRKGADKHLQR